ncbi:hypothetical protein L6452_43166 [Arctium lappa]|uniref:Uncharacterized protein n=1 Tax=Arctium lappa TaxID=4217 RepID=A0ACB8XLD7_ARCLA|nr:hypothetical protein L6452_43166 [Arctium lappa]
MEHEIKSELSDDGLPDNLRAPSDVHSTELLISSSDLLNLVNSDHHNFQEILAHEFHGMEGSAKALHVNLKHGLVSSKDEERRRIVFGTNTYIPPSWKCFHHFLLAAFKNPKKLILLACAVATLGFGIKDHGVQEGSYEIGGILATVMVAAICATTNFYQVKGKFDRLSELHNKLKIDVVRGGRRREIPIFDVVVGDVVVLNMGDRIPADGVFIEGSSLRVKEEEDSRILSTQNSDHTFLKSGSKVIDGRGKMLVFSVGMNTHWNKMMSFSNHCYDFDEQTRLQASVDKIASYFGIFASVIVFFYLLGTAIRHIPGNTKDENVKWRNTIDMIPSVSRCVVEMVEGLLLAVTLAQAFCMKSIMGHGLVKSMSDCEAIGSATVICSNKVGTLTTNKMEGNQQLKEFDPDIIDASFTDVVDMKIVQLYHQAVGLNTSGSVYKSSSVSGMATSECFGSPTEKAILLWGVNKLGIQMETLNQGFTILRVEPFDSEKKRSGVFIKMEQDHLIHVHEKGAAEVVLAMCSNYYETNGLTKPIKDDEKTKLEEIINGMSASGLRCIAFAHKQIPTNEPNIHNEDGNNKLNEEEGLTLLGVIGIKNPCRVGMKEAIEACRSAGVQVKMITGDSVFTAKAIATDCGILEAGPHVINNGEEVIEGKEFRNYTEEERMNRVDGIQVLASSSPSDKFLMVQCLEKKGHVVAVTGDDELAKETDHVILADNCGLAFILKVGSLSPEKAIPNSILKKAKRLAILTVAKVGMMVTYNVEDGSWSPPSAISSYGMGWGAQVGGKVMNFIIVLRNSDAVRTFGGNAHLSVGAGASAAAGIIGRTTEADLWAGDGGYAACYTYSCSKVAFVGCSLEGSMVTTQMQENCRFYGNPSIKTSDILLGLLRRPPVAAILFDALSKLYMKVEGR